MAQSGSCGVGTHGKTRFRTRDAPTRGTVTCSRHGTLLLDTVTGHRHRAPSQGTVSGQNKSSRAGGADGAVMQGHGTTLPGTAGDGIATSGVHMGIIVKFSEALPCVKSPVSRTSGTIYVVMYFPDLG